MAAEFPWGGPTWGRLPRVLRLVLLSLSTLLAACGSTIPPEQIEGATMGTRYHITWLAQGDSPDTERVRIGVEEILLAVNASMSTYQDDSEINRFNLAPVGQWITPSPDFLEVFRLAREVSEASDGAYDVTVAPLVDLWGFGPQRHSSVPPEADVEAARQMVGQQYVNLELAGQMRKERDLRLDFSSIAKGHGVDRVADWLAGQGIRDFLVEIGGEIRVMGLSSRGSPWRIAVEQPNSLQREVAQVLELVDIAVATSGDYRNYFEVDGVRYSHTLDPRTGRPVRHDLVSVTVLQSSAALADAWATALTTMGPADALSLAEERELPVYLISREGDGFRVDKSTAMAAYLR